MDFGCILLLDDLEIGAMNISVVTGILVKRRLREFLLVKKPEGVGPYAGMYLTPGGGVDIGEAVDEAVQRELYEETGVRVEKLRRVLFDDAVTENWRGKQTHYVMLLYTAEYVSGDLKPTAGDDDNLEVIDWFGVEQLRQLPLSPPLERLLEHLGYL